jgi:hypothetical protein
MKTYHIESRKEDILHTGNGRKANWIGHTLRRNCILKHVLEGEIEVTGRQGRRRKQLLDYLKKKARILGIKRESTRWRSVENSFWKSLWTCRKTGCSVMILTQGASEVCIHRD